MGRQIFRISLALGLELAVWNWCLYLGYEYVIVF